MTDVVYRFYDADGRLLYVGRTGKLVERMAQHRRKQPWFADIATTTLVLCSSYTAAIAAEAHAIKTENPLYNADLSAAAVRGHRTRKARNDSWHDAGFQCFDAGCRKCRDLPRRLPWRPEPVAVAS